MADDPGSVERMLRNVKQQRLDYVGQKFLQQTEKLEKTPLTHKAQKDKDKKSPPGGFDNSLPPHHPPGYTLKFVFHRAHNLPFADVYTLSSDPYIIATLKTDLPQRHKEDPDLHFRTPTIHRNTEPRWETEWTVANVPASGFFLKCRLYDEDPANHDDRLGNVHVPVNGISDTWPGIREQPFEVKVRMASKRAYLVRGCATMFSGDLHLRGELILSVENLGRTPDESGGKAYTIGPMHWSRHFSPLIGRLTGIKDSDDATDQDGKKVTQKYNFQAIQIQLAGPVPDELYHRYVEFRPFVAGMFTSHSLRGRILNRALHHQHARIYNYDRATVYGVFPHPTIDLTKKFLEFVHHDQGGRIFTYVITLDGQWRFTETGKEFGIDLLSKHTMHSDVNIYIAFSGEFFVRRLRKPPPSKEEREQNLSEDKPDHASIESPAPEPEEENKESSSSVTEPQKDPHLYELIIDNDSGTYRPNAKKLHLLRGFMEANLPGLKVRTLDCQADEEKMKKMKDRQREAKKNGGHVTYQQNRSDSSISSSDEDRLDRRAAGVDGGMMAMKKDKMRQKKEGVKAIASGLGGSPREEDGGTTKEEGELTNGEPNAGLHDAGHQPLRETKEGVGSNEKLGPGNGEVQTPHPTTSYHSQATTTT